MHIQKLFILLILTAGSLGSPLAFPHSATGTKVDSERATDPMPDISGLAWVERDTFLAAHDAKNPEENQLPRVSLLWLPRTLEGVRWKPLEIVWPTPALISSDLESIARIPGTSLYLLVESGESSYKSQRFCRIFLAELKGEQLAIRSFTELPAMVKNIEGSAVSKIGDRLVFVWAERGDGQAGTKLFWADLQLEPIRLGRIQQIYFKPDKFTGKGWRPVSAIEIDKENQVYIATAYDPDDDNGPFASVIWRAGQVKIDRTGQVRINLFSRPRQLARLDGLKVEGITVRERESGIHELFAGVDDENYGGALRQIPNPR